jgi:hypothetical protein
MLRADGESGSVRRQIELLLQMTPPTTIRRGHSADLSAVSQLLNAAGRPTADLAGSHPTGTINPGAIELLGAAYWFTAATYFANPAITIARSLTNTFSGIRPVDVPAFIAAQLTGALARFLFPSSRLSASSATQTPVAALVDAFDGEAARG